MKITSLLIFVLLFSITPGYAANCRVTKSADTNDASCTAGDCSLREAVADATCSTIDFSLDLVDVPVVLTMGEIVIPRTLSITGWAPDAITISGGGASRIFYIPAGNGLSISGVKLTGGNGVGTAPNGGGSIRCIECTLNLNNVLVTGNNSNGLGSAISLQGANSGGSIRNSLLTGNTGSGVTAAAVFMQTVNAQFPIYNTTIAANEGPGIHITGAFIKLINSTVAFENFGVYINGMANLTIGNSVVLNICRCSMLGGFTSSGNNIVSTTGGSNQIVFSGSDLVGVNPLLVDPPQRNGGPTANYALLPGSPAIDGGNNALAASNGLTTDQRGFARLADGNGDTTVTVDIGAFEHLAAAPAPSGLVTVAGRVFDTGNRPLSNVNVILNDTNGNYRFTYTSTFGWFLFENVPKEMVYRLNISSKRHNAPQRVLFPTADAFDVDIIATPLAGDAPRGK